MVAPGCGEDDPELDGVEWLVRMGGKTGASLKLVFRDFLLMYIDAALDRLDVPALLH